MKKNTLCKECKIVISTTLICDTCTARLSVDGMMIYQVGKHSMITIIRDDTEYHFCNYLCLLDFTLKEFRKERGKQCLN